MKGHIAMERRLLVLPKQEPFGFTKIADVRVNSRVTGIQMYFFLVGGKGGLIFLDYRIRRDGSRRFDGLVGWKGGENWWWCLRGREVWIGCCRNGSGIGGN
jgi:hypothetical protein